MKALQCQGQITIQTSFHALGQFAGQELFSSPDVATVMSGLEKMLRQQQFEVLAEKNSKQPEQLFMVQLICDVIRHQ